MEVVTILQIVLGLRFDLLKSKLVSSNLLSISLLALIGVSLFFVKITVYNFVNWMQTEFPKVEHDIYQWCVANPDGVVTGDLHYECKSFIPDYEKRVAGTK